MKIEGARIVVVDDDAAMCETLAVGLRRRHFEVTSFVDPAEAVGELPRIDPEVVVTDLNMQGLNGLELCERAHAALPGLPVVVLTAFGSLETAVGAIRAGAYDFVTKPVDIELLVLSLERAIAHRRLTLELTRLREQGAAAEPFADLVGDSAPMRRVHDLIARVASSDVTVLVTGESGTGKELVARALHRASRRRDGPFVGLSCAALPEALLESELFGHVRGAFTDARQARTGMFLSATGGTLLLDEIGELPAATQAKLLRALQERVVRPVGSDREQPFDARIIAATNRDLQELVEQGQFREDLFYRLNVVPIHLPPLRARGNDLLKIAQRLLERASVTLGREVRRISPPAARRLLGYEWPGNVRELQNSIEHAVALARYDEITVDDLPERIGEAADSPLELVASDPSAFVALEEMERRYILQVLQSVGGHRSLAARILGLDRKTLYRKLERWRDQDGEP